MLAELTQRAIELGILNWKPERLSKKRLAEDIEHLQSVCPLKWPVEVLVKRGPDFGEYRIFRELMIGPRGGKKWKLKHYIYIAPVTASWREALLHEWTHAKLEEHKYRYPEGQDHPNRFWRIYGKLYREFFEA